MTNRVHQGHLARKRFGQNFLNDQFVIDSIVAAINPQKGQAMVEIGPGLAALTEPVGERLDELTVIELDRDLAARLQTHPFLGPKLTIYQQDAILRPDYYICAGARVMDFSGSVDLDKIMMLMEVEMQMINPGDDVIIVGAKNSL